MEPNQGHEVEYNRWYERDHFYAGCMIGPWLFAGKRWVATRAMKDLRFPVDADAVAAPIDRGSYLATYWVLEGKHDEHFAWAGRPGRRSVQERPRIHGASARPHGARQQT